MNQCSKHHPEISFVKVPLSKACRNCGHIEPLNGNELFWPARSKNAANNNHTRFRFVRFTLWLSSAAVVAGLIASGMLLYSKVSRLPIARIQPGSSAQRHISSTLIIPGDRRSRAAESVAPSATNGAPSETEINKEFQDSSHEEARVFFNRYFSNQAPNTSAEAGTKQMERRVSKAIADRAISGVYVTVEHRTAYLQGKVQTQTQRLIAERAARSIPGLGEVKNLIGVEWQSENN
jgi:hypothetical protein